MTEPTTDLRERLVDAISQHCRTHMLTVEGVAAAVLPVVHAELNALRLRIEQVEVERDTHAHLLEHWADEHIILKTVSGPDVHATWCYRCRIERAEATTQQLRDNLPNLERAALMIAATDHHAALREFAACIRAIVDRPADATRTPPPA